MGKFRVSFDVDLGHIEPEVFAGSEDPNASAETVLNKFLEDTRKQSLLELRKLQQRKDLPVEEQRALMVQCLRRSMLTLQAQANLKLDRLPDDTVIPTDLPERLAA